MHTWTSSGLKTSDAAIVARPCRIHAVTVISDGTNAATAIIYDNASAASGNVVAKVVCAGATRTQVITSEDGIECSNGAYLDIGGTDAETIVHYSLL